MAVFVAKRFLTAVERAEDTHRLRAILEMSSRDELMGWTDESGLDLLHHCILLDNPQAMDFLLKQGYFVRPFIPRLSLYVHLAAYLGLKTAVSVLLQHRPDDFRVAGIPLLLPHGFNAKAAKTTGTSSSTTGAGSLALDVSVRPGKKASILTKPSQQSPIMPKPPQALRTRSASLGKSSSVITPSQKPPSDLKLCLEPSSLPKASQGSRPGSARLGNNFNLFRPSSISMEKSGAGLGNNSNLPKPLQKKSSSVPEPLQSTANVSSDNFPPKPSPGPSSASKRGSTRPPAKSVVFSEDGGAGVVADGHTVLLMTPLEVAASGRRLDCVRVLLDLCVLKANPEAPNKGYMTLSALADCPQAMALVMQSPGDKNSHSDYKAAVEVCVQRVRPECLDLLLATPPSGLDPKGIFKGINFFHVLYTFSASYGKGTYGRLPDVTRVLIARGHNVNSRLPPRTYPMYTLLTHAFCFHDYSNTQHYVSCLRLLLKAGADPNFDEPEFERHLLNKQGLKFVAGRDAFASGLHCLLETVETYASQLDSPTLAAKFVEECAETLVNNKADLLKVGRIGDARSDLQGNVLHQYAKSSVTIGVDKVILQTILRSGAEPDVKVKGKYALNVYFDKLFEHMSHSHSTAVNAPGHKNEDDIRLMTEIMCRFMTPLHIKEAAAVFYRSHSTASSRWVKRYFEWVYSELQSLSREVGSLQGLAAWRVWILCGKRAQVVRSLPIKVELKTRILPLL